MRLTAAEIATRAGGEVVAGDPDVVVTSWGFDSRALAPGACFVALPDHRDGHDFVSDAFRAGAHAALVERSVPFSSRPGHPHALVQVPNVLRGLQDVAPVGAPGARRPRRRRRHRVDRQDVDEGSAGRRAASRRCLREPGVVQQRVRAPDHVAQRAGAGARRRRGDGGAVPRRRRVPVRDRPAAVRRRHQRRPRARRASRRRPRASPRVLAELVEAVPAHGAVVLNADDRWTPWLRDRSAAPVETVGFARRRHAPDHGCRGRRRPASRRSRSEAAGSGSGCAARTRCPTPRWRAVAANVAHGVPFADERGAHRRRARVALAHGARRDPRRTRRPQRLVQRESDVDGRGVARARRISASTAAASRCSATCASSVRTARRAHAPIGRLAPRPRHRHRHRRRHGRRARSRTRRPARPSTCTPSPTPTARWR